MFITTENKVLTYTSSLGETAEQKETKPAILPLSSEVEETGDKSEFSSTASNFFTATKNKIGKIIDEAVSDENRAHQLERERTLQSKKKLTKEEISDLFKKDKKYAEERAKKIEELAQKQPDFYKDTLKDFDNLSVGNQQALVYKMIEGKKVPSTEEARVIAEKLKNADPAVQGFAKGIIKKLETTNPEYYKQLTTALKEGYETLERKWTNNEVTANEMQYDAHGAAQSGNSEIQQACIHCNTHARPSDIEGQKHVCEYIIDSKICEDKENREYFASSLSSLPSELQADVHRYAYESRNFDSTEDRNNLISVIKDFDRENQLKASQNVLNSSKTDKENLAHFKKETQNFEKEVIEKLEKIQEQKNSNKTNQTQKNNAKTESLIKKFKLAILNNTAEAQTPSNAIFEALGIKSENETPRLERLADAIKKHPELLVKAINMSDGKVLNIIGAFDIDTQNKIIAESKLSDITARCANGKFTGRLKEVAMNRVKSSSSIDAQLANMLIPALSYEETKGFAINNGKISATASNVFKDALNKKFSSELEQDREKGNIA